MIDASVIICTHNPRPHYLDRVLEALRNQVLPYDRWELLLVDNASDRAMAPLWDICWHPNARHIREDELGLAAARRRGITEAAADLMVFVDDDNVLAGDYLVQALKIKQKWPALGTWGSGTIVPEFERQPAEHLRPYMVSLALRDNKKAYWSNVLSCYHAMPPGAGMCVRADVAREYCRLHSAETIRLTGRKGTALVGHEDCEIAYVGCSVGFGMGVFPELMMTHLIPKERVSDKYILRLVEGNQVSGGLLAYKWLGETPQPFSTMSILLMFIRVILTGNLFHRRLHLAQVRGRIAARREIAKHVSVAKVT
jgi:hypothetical protein